jgi:hypothetical protein
MATHAPSPVPPFHQSRPRQAPDQRALELLAVSSSFRPPRRGGGPTPGRRRALELLAACPEGCTASILQARGVPVQQVVELVHAGLATARTERVLVGRTTIELARVKITNEGRKAVDNLEIVRVVPR